MRRSFLAGCSLILIGSCASGNAAFADVLRVSSRTISLAVAIDRDDARLIAFTLKDRPFVRAIAVPAARPYEEGKNTQIEMVLLGPGGASFAQRVEIARLCLTHAAGTAPHVAGDTIVVHQDSLVVEMPELTGFDRVEIAYCRAGVGGAERRLLATENLSAIRFVAAGGPLRYADLAFAKPEAAPDESMLMTTGKVYWPEDYGDTDIYKVYGSEAETASRINVVLVPDGYTYADKALMESHVESVIGYFRGKTPYREHDPFINYTLVYAYSSESGTDQCDCGIVKDTAMASRFPNDGYPCGDSGNRCLYYGGGCDVDSSAQIAQAELRAPAKDMAMVMVNTARYGGCGGERAVYAAGNSSAAEIAVHELGHSLGGLADEYVSYPYCGAWASEINTSTNGTEGAWPEWIPQLGSPREGADYFARCIYRPKANCDMRSLNQPFCEVCNQHFSLVFFGHWRVSPSAPIASQSPASPLTVETGASTPFSVTARLAVGPSVTNTITWRLQGPGFPEPTVVATGVTAYARAFAAEGSYTLTCEVVADTNFIKPSRNGANVDVATWNVSAVLARPREVSPPGSVQPLVFTDAATLVWESAAVSGSTTFNLYRGSEAALPSGDYGSCLVFGLDASTAQDSDSPLAGACWTYLVTGKTTGGEGSLGNDSLARARQNLHPCP